MSVCVMKLADHDDDDEDDEWDRTGRNGMEWSLALSVLLAGRQAGRYAGSTTALHNSAVRRPHNDD